MNTTTKVSAVFKIVNISINVSSVKANILLSIVLISKLFISYQHQELFKRPSQSHQLFASLATNIKQTPFVRTGSTPVKVDLMCPYLSVYPNKSIADELKNGFRFGFYLHYEGPRISTTCTNLVSVKDYPKVVKEKIDKENALGRIAGPFNYEPLGYLRLSPIGVVAKKDGGWRLIHYLSYPFDYSVNDFIDTEACSVHYTSFDEVLDMIAKQEPF